ncbi:MAG: bifunctional hydroxymethylpyrimidine kinase/phosphomethylpyrimidine kinase, partial [Clostridia bacterium]|nr:bifunctional hydroxymethylpyrimidine kinase/phosphomethylpyrimidine kinase [Clostridia bacterium]
TILTPNLPEAELLTERPAACRKEREEAAKAIFAMGCKGVLLKGGHLIDSAEDLFYDGGDFITLSSPLISTTSTHGTGCTLSSALVSALILGQPPMKAAASAKAYVTAAIAAAPGLGRGHGPLHHFFNYDFTEYKGEK